MQRVASGSITEQLKCTRLTLKTVVEIAPAGQHLIGSLLGGSRVYPGELVGDAQIKYRSRLERRLQPRLSAPQNFLNSRF